MADALGLGLAARDFASRFFSQGATASGILMIPGHLKKEAQQEAMKDFAKIATGIKGQHRVAILQNDVKFQPLSVDAQKSQMLQMRQFEIREVANILGLPPHKLGDPTRTSFSSLEQENQSTLDESYDPWLCAWEEETSDKLLTEAEKEADSHFMEFNRSALLKTDSLTRHRIYALRRQWGLSNVNELRSKENDDPIGEQGDIFLSPGNMVDAKSLLEDEPESEDEPEPEDDPDLDNTSDNSNTDENDEATRQASFEAILDRLERLQKIEVDQVCDAAKRDSNFLEWMEKFYAQQELRIEEALTPILRVWYSLRRKSGNGRDAALEASAVALEIVNRSRQDFLVIAGDSTKEMLAANVERLVELWGSDRLRHIVEELMEDV